MRKTLLTLALLTLAALPAAHGQHPVTVLQDCWTTENPPGAILLEGENYLFPAGVPITFVWKHKLTDPNEPCTNYVVSIYGFRCQAGKPRPTEVAWAFPDIRYGEVFPDPEVPEQLLFFTAPPGSIPPGSWDWAMLVECNDSGNGIALGADGDIDDECGVNVGTQPVVVGPVILGPEPVEFFDAHPGGFPPGRGAGEEGTTRPWCFQVEPDFAEPDLVTCHCKDGTDVFTCTDVLDCQDAGAINNICVPTCLPLGGLGGSSCSTDDPSCVPTEGGGE